MKVQVLSKKPLQTITSCRMWTGDLQYRPSSLGIFSKANVAVSNTLRHKRSSSRSAPVLHASPMRRIKACAISSGLRQSMLPLVAAMSRKSSPTATTKTKSMRVGTSCWPGKQCYTTKTEYTNHSHQQSIVLQCSVLLTIKMLANEPSAPTIMDFLSARKLLTRLLSMPSNAKPRNAKLVADTVVIQKSDMVPRGSLKK